MKLERKKIRFINPFPEVFSKNRKYGKLILREARVKMSRHSRLSCKLLIFRTWKDMDDFFTHYLLRPNAVDMHTRGVCTRLDWHVESFKTDPPTLFTEVDPRHFAVIGLIQSKIDLEVVAHECVHAAFAYAERANTNWTGIKDDHPEESVCYPAGKLTQQIWNYLVEEDLLPKK